jgi:hypothetical protein
LLNNLDHTVTRSRIRIPCTVIFLLSLFLPLMRGGSETSPAPLSLALNQIYNSRFEQSRQTLEIYSGQHPTDPLAYALTAATYLFADLARSGALNTDLLGVVGGKQESLNPASRLPFDAAVHQARRCAAAALKTDPDDQNSLLAVVIASGVQRDYLALIDHRYRESYDYIKESESYSARLLKVNPCAYDAYFTKGFTEYLIGSMPLVLRWFMKIDGLLCTRQQGLQDLQLAAGRGHYLKPFAQMMLAMFYLKEKQTAKTEELLTDLTHDFPENPTFRTELLKLRSRNTHLIN